MILLKIRGSCISCASFKKKEETRLEEELMSSINNMKIIFVKAMYIY